MKIKLILITLLLSSSFFYGQTTQKTIIDGTLTGGAKFTEISILDAMTGNEIQKVQITDKKFHFDFVLGEENVYALYLDRQNYLLMDLKPGEKINIDYNVDAYDKTKISGSVGSEFYFKTLSTLKQTPEEKQDQFLDSIVNANPGKLVSVVFAMYLDLEQYAETHKKLIKSIDELADNQFVTEYKKNFDASQKLAIGNIPPEISLADTSGKIVNLSSLKGQYVLVDFWAAWCRPCRGESPNLVKAYNKYHSKGFTIYSISLDEAKADWENAIINDNLQAWTHVSDLKGWSSKAAADYGVRSIPANFLLDKEGKIIAKNLRGDKLEEKLAQIFKN